MNASTFTARVIVSTLSDWPPASSEPWARSRGRCTAARRATCAHDRRDRDRRERRALAAPQARGGRGADGIRAPRLPHLRSSRASARRGGGVARGRERAPGAGAAGRGDRASPAGRAKPGRKLYTNVEYYAAVVLGGIALRRPLPATSQPHAPRAGRLTSSSSSSTNRLIRPTVDYVGPMPES